MTRAIVEVAIARMQRASDALAATFTTDAIDDYERAAAEASVVFNEWRLACLARAQKANAQRKERS